MAASNKKKHKPRLSQVTKFYLTSFLKNQTYFTPILIIFLQANQLTYKEIFWVFTIGSIFSFIMEIPTGVIADLWGKRKCIIISKLGILISYVLFALSRNFWMFALAQLIYELGNSFRTGTETAYTYDYLQQNPGKNQSYKIVKTNQKFWARVSESVATALGGFLAIALGYNMVFLIAAVPALFNLILAISWEEIKENQNKKFSLTQYRSHAKSSLIEIFRRADLLTLTLNITIFEGVLVVLEKFVQPYMADANIPVGLFGMIYTASLLMTAVSIRYSDKVEEIFGSRNLISILTMIAFIPTVIIGLKFISVIGVILFFFVVMIGNFISPVANDKFHSIITSEKRATLGSILELFKSSGKIILMPLAGFFADVFSMYTAILIMGFILLASGAILHIGTKHVKA